MERIAYIIFGIVAVLYLLALVTGLILAFPFGIIGLLVLAGLGLLLWKAFSDRSGNKEDDYYDKNIDQ